MSAEQEGALTSKEVERWRDERGAPSAMHSQGGRVRLAGGCGHDAKMLRGGTAHRILVYGDTRRVGLGC